MGHQKTVGSSCLLFRAESPKERGNREKRAKQEEKKWWGVGESRGKGYKGRHGKKEGCYQGWPRRDKPTAAYLQTLFRTQKATPWLWKLNSSRWIEEATKTWKKDPFGSTFLCFFFSFLSRVGPSSEQHRGCLQENFERTLQMEECEGKSRLFFNSVFLSHEWPQSQNLWQNSKQQQRQLKVSPKPRGAGKRGPVV